MRAAATRAERGGMLSAAELSELAGAIAGGLAARAGLEAQAEPAPLLNELAAPIDAGLRQLGEEIESRVENDGSDLRDTASPRLRRLRKELREGRHRVAEELRRLARRSELREHLQEDFVTQRGGRPVLAVKASSRRAVPGVVHDASSSGETLFIEPFEVVELSNRQSEAAGAEREEVERILRELTAAVADRAEEVRTLVEAAAEIDLAIARGVLSGVGAALRSSPPTTCGWSERAIPCSIRRSRSRSTSSSGPCRRSSSAGRTPEARRWR